MARQQRTRSAARRAPGSPRVGRRSPPSAWSAASGSAMSRSGRCGSAAPGRKAGSGCHRVGEFNANQLSIVAGGKAAVHASLGERVANAEVIARLAGVRVDPSLPANTPDLFSGPETGDLAPTLLYPSDDISMPRNLGDF